ncbi:ATP-binding protein [Roseibium sp. MMSF_3544]|uniref:HAMP domain-containing sensor histidine kinase n=1 Tax=unclassified Roseibium TaxID=2629323 RepID=UPI0027400E76|nr:ATP-binding protein [Roseibium sp. MMSF_3544]
MLSRSFRDRWRPSISLVIALVLGIMLLVPLAGIVFFRVYENQLVETTEAELIAQSAAIAATAAQLLVLQDADNLNFETELPAAGPLAKQRGLLSSDYSRQLKGKGEWTPQLPELDLNKTAVLPARPDPLPGETPPHPAYLLVGSQLDPILKDTQKLTLAGFRVLDTNGLVIAGRDETGLSLAHIDEVQMALAGRYASVLRERVVNNPQPIYSISRGTSVRVFVAMPIIVGNHVAGVVYTSRTPSNILKEMFLKRETVFWVLAFVLSATVIVGIIFSRGISGPIKALTERSLKIGRGDREALKPLSIHGNREIHALSSSMLDTSRKLFERNDYINTFANHVTHELKSPLTAIQGAAELLQDGGDELSEAERAKFLKNILTDTDRASRLLNRLRDLARADSVEIGGSCRLSTVLGEIRGRFEGVDIGQSGDCDLPLSPENARIVFENMIDNSARHGADAVSFDPQQSETALTLRVSDNGDGISPGNRDQVFDLFFTTRRANGGTGMGLGIIRALLRAHQATIELLPQERGACFVIRFPVTRS